MKFICSVGGVTGFQNKRFYVSTSERDKNFFIKLNQKFSLN